MPGEVWAVWLDGQAVLWGDHLPESVFAPWADAFGERVKQAPWHGPTPPYYDPENMPEAHRERLVLLGMFAAPGVWIGH